MSICGCRFYNFFTPFGGGSLVSGGETWYTMDYFVKNRRKTAHPPVNT